MKIFDTALPQNYSKGLFEEKCLDLAPEHTDKIADVLFTGVANLLSSAKSKDHPTAFNFVGMGDKFIASAICQFFPNEDTTRPGNWSLVFTFDQSDVPVDANVISITDPQTHSYFRAIAGDKYGFRFKTPEYIITMLTYLLEHIYKWLDENAEEGKEVSVELDSIFQARVAVENGEKVFALEPDGEIKKIIKDDASDEK